MLNFKRTRILVVDDEDLNLELIAECLDSTEYQLDMVDGGYAAWAMLNQVDKEYDLVILDRMMPGMNGLELLRKIKADTRLAALPVIIQTAAASQQEVTEGIDAGAFYYLTKPYKPATLAGIVRAVVADANAKKRIVDELEQQNDALHTLVQATFEFSTLAQASNLASLLAHMCPNPEAVAMGLCELMANAIEHGNLEIGCSEKSVLIMNDLWDDEISRRLQLPQYRDRRAKVIVENRADAVTFCIKDQGKGFDWQRYLELSPERMVEPNGRGIAMARMIAFTRMEFLGAGNVVVATVSRSAGDVRLAALAE